MHLLPPALLLALLSPTLGAASPQPALISSDYAISLVPRHTLFLRQMSDLQTFDSALAGVHASPITNSGDTERPFKVTDDTFPDFATAAQRSCDEQFQGCQKAANGGGDKPRGSADAKGKGKGKSNKRQDDGLSVGDCDKQKNMCLDAQQKATAQDFKTGVPSTNIGPDPAFPDFDLICEG